MLESLHLRLAMPITMIDQSVLRGSEDMVGCFVYIILRYYLKQWKAFLLVFEQPDIGCDGWLSFQGK